MLVFPLLFSSFSSAEIIVAFLLMHLLKSAFLLFTFLISHHVESIVYQRDIPVSTSWCMQQIRTANDFHPFSPVANHIFGGFNCHLAHHLFPAIPHTYYPAISQIIYRHLQEHGVEVHQTSYIGGILSHVKLLKRLAKETSLVVDYV